MMRGCSNCYIVICGSNIGNAFKVLAQAFAYAHRIEINISENTILLYFVSI